MSNPKANVNGKESAYPVIDGELKHISQWGLSKREVFAMAALQAVIPRETSAEMAAELATEYADKLEASDVPKLLLYAQPGMITPEPCGNSGKAFLGLGQGVAL